MAGNTTLHYPGATTHPAQLHLPLGSSLASS